MRKDEIGMEYTKMQGIGLLIAIAKTKHLLEDKNRECLNEIVNIIQKKTGL